MVENGRRELPIAQVYAVAQFYRLRPTVFPLPSTERWTEIEPSEIASELAALGYPALAYLCRHLPTRNPAELLMAALLKNNLEVRVVEGLPWLACSYTDLNWDWCIEQAKLGNIANRLGFVVSLARELSEMHRRTASVETLRWVEDNLRPAVLLRSQTLCREHMTQAERRWLKSRSSTQAKSWNLLSDFSAKLLAHAV